MGKIAFGCCIPRWWRIPRIKSSLNSWTNLLSPFVGISYMDLYYLQVVDCLLGIRKRKCFNVVNLLYWGLTMWFLINCFGVWCQLSWVIRYNIQLLTFLKAFVFMIVLLRVTVLIHDKIHLLWKKLADFS